MQNVISLYKPLGLTPLQAINHFREQNPLYNDAKISYAGRLDPMAEGLLLLLVNDENKKRKAYEDLPKTYEFSLLVGIATDTYDLMGKITDTRFNGEFDKLKTNLESLLPSFKGTTLLPYPPYSSRTVNGKPLYWYTRRNVLHEIKIPTKRVHISNLLLLSSSLLPSSTLLSYISRVIPKVNGDFRQEEIVKLWHDSSPLFPTQIPKIEFRITCSSGTYVRGIVHELGKKLGIPTVTYSIKRTRVGAWDIKDATRLKNAQKC